MINKPDQSLLPCPYCGSSDLQLYKPDCNPAREAWVSCLNCSQLAGNIEDAIKAWNTRASISYPEALEKVARAIYNADRIAVDWIKDGKLERNKSLNYEEFIESSLTLEKNNLSRQAKAALAAMGIEEGE